MKKPTLRSKYSKAINLDMVFKDIQTAMDFLQDLGNKLPNMFEFSPPENPNEYLRATEGGQTIVLYKSKKMSTNGSKMTVGICGDFCNLIGEYSVWDIVSDKLRSKI